jgi:ABC-type siderophore export system fused ATPase/permease subunit
LLPALSRAGVTLVAISHDDRYIEQMDVRARKLHMDEGRLFEQTAAENG